MITTNTGAKKLESSDNWREIFPNPGTSAAGAHNASVDAQDRIQAEVAPIINGKRCSLGAASGDYVLLRNSTIAGKTDGAYVAAKAIPANTDLDSTYLGSAITGGISNAINNNIANKTSVSYTANIPHSSTGAISICRYGRMRVLQFSEVNLSSDITLTNLADADKADVEYDSVLCNYSSNKIARIWIRPNSNSLGVAPNDSSILYTGELVYISKE